MRLPDSTLQALLDQARRLVIALDREGRVAYANRVALDTLGWTGEELSGRDFFDTCVADAARGEARAGFQLLLSGDMESGEFVRERIRTRSGETPVVEWHNSLLVDDDDYVTGLLCLGTVVERTSQEEDAGAAGRRARAATARARRFQELFDVSPVGYLVVSPDRRILLSNARAAELLGYKADRLVGRHVSTIAPPDPDEDQHAGDLLDRMYAGEHLVDEEVSVQSADGRTLWLKGNLHPVLDDDGRVVEGRIAFADATDLHADRERARLYSSIVDHMPIGVVVLEMDDPDDPDSFRVVDANDACRIQTGVDSEGWAGARLADASPESIRSGRHRTYAEVARTGQSRRMGELPWTTPDGRRLWLMVEAFALPGHRLGIAFENITERKQTELALERRTDELARSNRDLEQFASVASHDLRAPLQVILGRIEMLEASLGDRLDSRQQRHVDQARETVLRMDRLIDDLLQFARIGRGGPAHDRVDTAALCHQALSDLDASIVETGARVLHADLPPVLGHETQLGQLFRNLIANALKFRAPDRPPRVIVQAERAGQRWRFSVIDNGVGFDPDEAEDVFRMFHRVRGGGEVPGTGIGLAICRRIVEQHDGQIWAESRPGEGTAFHFTLPAADE
ncbi:MAG: PAS domain-containing sensor histidine kinase [Myxococcota bacterium]